MNGKIFLDRKILEWEWYSDVKTKCVFLHLLIRANWKDVSWHGVVIKRGQLVTSLPTLCEELNLSMREIRTALSHLIRTGEIERKTTNKYSIITVKKYDEYQQKDVQTADDRKHSDKKKDNDDPVVNTPPEAAKRKTTKTMIDEEGFDDLLTETLYRWVRYKNEKNQRYKQTGFASFLTRIKKSVEKYGVDAVVDVIDFSMSQNYQGVVWDKLNDKKNQSYNWWEDGE